MTNNDKESRREFRYFTPIAGLFVAALLISNTTAGKLIQLGTFTFPGGIIVFPISYIFGDILTEVYGYVRARRIIWTGFVAEIFMSLIYWAVIALPSAPFWPHQEAISAILGQVPRIVLATIMGYVSGEFVNSYIMAQMKMLTKGKYLWTRTIGSTVAGEGVDTILFISIAFAGVFPATELLRTMFSVYVFKVVYETIATPITYIIVGFLKKKESVDFYDHDTKFTPFQW